MVRRLLACCCHGDLHGPVKEQQVEIYRHAHFNSIPQQDVLLLPIPKLILGMKVMVKVMQGKCMHTHTHVSSC